LVTFITSIILFLKWKRYEILWLLASVFISTIIAILSKAIIARPRPKLAVYLENWYSFPSFHAVISVALYWFIIWLFLSKIKKIKTKINIIFGWIIIIFFIWLSRLYLNVHYLSDIISGWFLWFLWLIFWITIIWYLKHTVKQKNYIYFKKYNKIIIYSIILFWIIFLVFYYNIYYSNIIFFKKSEIKYTQIEDIKDFLDTKSHLKYTETITWRKTEPINFIFIVKNEDDLIKSFENSWWEEADRLWKNSIIKTWKAIIMNTQYDTAPITPLYWNKKIQILWFQKLTKEENIRYRHHIRIWKSDYKIWKNYIYFGCWVYDDWLKWWIITHKIDPNLDKERDYTFNDLFFTGFIKKFELIILENTFKWTNFSWDKFFTDWKAYVLDFK
jgi:undecaprenyl-diphosphatase